MRRHAERELAAVWRPSRFALRKEVFDDHLTAVLS